MAKINLLPWREGLRKQRQTEFIAYTVASFIGAGVLVFLIHLLYGHWQNNQEARNARIQTEISSLDKEIAEIKTLRDKREQLLSRMRVIQELQGNRPVIVRVFDELARSLANGVFYKTVKMEGEVLSVAGTAEANNRVSALMRNVDGSAWFVDPNLKGIKENQSFGPQASDFELTFKRVNPRATPQEDGEGAAGEGQEG